MGRQSFVYEAIFLRSRVRFFTANCKKKKAHVTGDGMGIVMVNFARFSPTVGYIPLADWLLQ